MSDTAGTDYHALFLLDGLPDDYEHWGEKLPDMPRGDEPVLFVPSLLDPKA